MPGRNGGHGASAPRAHYHGTQTNPRDERPLPAPRHASTPRQGGGRALDRRARFRRTPAGVPAGGRRATRLAHGAQARADALSGSMMRAAGSKFRIGYDMRPVETRARIIPPLTRHCNTVAQQLASGGALIRPRSQSAFIDAEQSVAHRAWHRRCTPAATRPGITALPCAITRAQSPKHRACLWLL